MKLSILVALCVILGVSSSTVEEFSPFVINGVRTPVAPYFAFIQYFNLQGLGFFGGGALVSTRHILTAATNVQGYEQIFYFCESRNSLIYSPGSILSRSTWGRQTEQRWRCIQWICKPSLCIRNTFHKLVPLTSPFFDSWLRLFRELKSAQSHSRRLRIHSQYSRGRTKKDLSTDSVSNLLDQPEQVSSCTAAIREPSETWDASSSSSWTPTELSAVKMSPSNQARAMETSEIHSSCPTDAKTCWSALWQCTHHADKCRRPLTQEFRTTASGFNSNWRFKFASKVSEKKVGIKECFIMNQG